MSRQSRTHPTVRVEPQRNRRWWQNIHPKWRCHA